MTATKSPSPQPIVILFLGANPSSPTRLRLDQEVRAIDQALRLANYRDQFDLRQQWAVRVADLQELLLRHQPHIVHFSVFVILHRVDSNGGIITNVRRRLWKRIRPENCSEVTSIGATAIAARPSTISAT